MLNVEGDPTKQLAKFAQHHIFVAIQEWLHYTIFTFSIQEWLHYTIFTFSQFAEITFLSQSYYFSTFKILIANLDRKHFEF